MRSGIYRNVVKNTFNFTGYRMDFGNSVNLIAEKFDSENLFVGICGANFDNVAANTKLIADKIHIVALILHVYKLIYDFVAVFFHSRAERKHHSSVIYRVAESIDAGNGSNDYYVASFGKSCGCGMAEPFDFVVYVACFFNISIGGSNICFRLIIIIIGNEIFNAVFGKKLFEFAAKLGGKSFVMGKNNGRAVYFFNYRSHCERLTGTGYTEKGLFPVAAVYSFNKFFNCLGLVAGRFKR